MQLLTQYLTLINTQINFYLSNEILRNSPAMLACAAEVMDEDVEEVAA